MGWLDPVFVWLTRLGTYGALWLLLAAVLAYAWRRPQVFLFVAAADVVAEAVTGGLKSLIQRDRPAIVYPRPAPLVHDPHTYAFPSGHAATSFACATVLARLWPRGAPAFLVLAAAVAFSRVYVGVHWPLDVIAGALVGVVVALFVMFLTRRRRHDSVERRGVRS